MLMAATLSVDPSVDHAGRRDPCFKDDGMNSQPDEKPTPTEDAVRAQDLARYREGVETLLKMKSSQPISNSEPAHAAILFEVFFKHAKQKVRIFCQKLSENIYGRPEVVEAARRALERNVEIDVVIQDDKPEESDFLKLLRARGVDVCIAKDEKVKTSKYNFAVMDKEAVRIEPDRDHCTAQARLYAPTTAASLSETFDRIAKVCHNAEAVA